MTWATGSNLGIPEESLGQAQGPPLLLVHARGARGMPDPGAARPPAATPPEPQRGGGAAPRARLYCDDGLGFTVTTGGLGLYTQKNL